MFRNRKKLRIQLSFTIQASGQQVLIHPTRALMIHVDNDRYIFSGGKENNRR